MNEGRKDDGGKCRLDLIPVGALWEVGKVYTMGASKYDDWNWASGIKYSRLIGALLRHLFKWVSGEIFDQEDGQHHLSSVVWCGLSLLHYDLNWKEYGGFDDRKKDWNRPWVEEKDQKIDLNLPSSLKEREENPLLRLSPYQLKEYSMFRG